MYFNNYHVHLSIIIWLFSWYLIIYFSSYCNCLEDLVPIDSTFWSVMSKRVVDRHTAWWRHQMETFSALLALCAGKSPVPVNSPHKGQWRGALMFSVIYAWINDWVNDREAGDLRRQRGHYDVIVMENLNEASHHWHQLRFSLRELVAPWEMWKWLK